MKSLILVGSVLLGLSSVSLANQENKSADAQAVNAACSSDAATASCGNEKVGTGLLKCLHAYKKEHKDYKFSDSCKTAMKTMREDRAKK